MEENIKAAFSLENYIFTEFSFKRPEKSDVTLLLAFNPSGKYHSKDGKFELNIGIACDIEDSPPIGYIKANLSATFRFSEILPFDKIPNFFYVNSIAIIFPYVRAFIGTLTLQANAGLVILPTMNLSDLEQPLKQNTIVVD